MSLFLTQWLDATWGMLVDSAPYLLLGLIIAGLIGAFLNERNLPRLMGTKPSQAVWRAALLGVPLPLCSCSVLPVADQLRRAGLSRGGTVSFLISTPESSADSILLTYALTDPLLTVARPVAAFISAAAAGLTENAFDRGDDKLPSAVPPPETCHDGCGCATEVNENGSLGQRLWGGLRHAFTTLIEDLAPYLFVGYLLAGLVAITLEVLNISPTFFGANPTLSYLGALLIGLPLYVCASSSTPLAAVLLAAGFPPGAILVFLLVGPATNLATIAVVKRILGLAATFRYLLIITLVSILTGLLLDWLYRFWNITPHYSPGTAIESGGIFSLICAILLTALILYHSFRWLLAKVR